MMKSPTLLMNYINELYKYKKPSSNSSSRGLKVLNSIWLHLLRRVSRDAEYDAEGDAEDLLKP